MKYHFDCAHTTQNIPWDEPVPDYYPLTESRIVELLLIARQAKNPMEVSSILVRLSQGIEGMFCPLVDGVPLVEQRNKLTRLAKACIHEGADVDRTARTLYALMQADWLE